MRVTGFVTAAAFVLATSVGMYAQAKPDFSGKWVMDAPAAAPAAPPADGGGGRGGGRGGGGGAGFGQTFTAKQDAKMLTVERVQGDATVTAMYMLDGSESKNTVARSEERRVGKECRSRWSPHH